MSQTNLSPSQLQLSQLREPVIKGKTSTESWRRVQLTRLEKLIETYENEILKALKKDLDKPKTEAVFELIALKQELKLANTKLNTWMRPQRINIPLSLKPGEAVAKCEPLGCVLIIGPWNYPFSLTLQPLISALAAGNTAVLKPSEHAPNISKLIAELIPKYFPENVVQVFQGDGIVAQTLLSKKFDHIFFTGGASIGKEIMRAAAEHLTPVTLELGGQSPAIILKGSDLEVTARRLVWGKGLNAGQTCIAPNHLLVLNELKKPLLSKMKEALREFYGDNPVESVNLAKIINDHQFKRLKELLEGAVNKKQVLAGGEIDISRQRISPTLIEINNINDPLMKDEIFGPLMPIMTISNLQEAIDQINQQTRPLALYLFGGTEEDQCKVLNQTSSGGVCFNDVIMQAGIPELPFGGVGNSGMGRYHGEAGFKTFSNQRAILKRPFWLDLKLRYPPYNLDISILKNLLS